MPCTAISGSLESILYNPAGLGEVASPRLGLAFHSAFSYRQWYAAGALPLRPVGTLGLSVKVFSFDEQLITGSSDPDEVLARFTPRATELRLTVARSLGGRIMLGASLGFYDVQIAPAGLYGGFHGGGTSVGGDVGVLVRPIARVPLSVGAAVLSLGRGIAFADDADREPLPRRLRAGLSLEVLRWLAPKAGERLSLLVGFDSEQPLVPGAGLDLNIQHVGAELGVGDVFFLRTGFTHDPLDSATTVALGLGVRIKSFSFDLARLVEGNEFVNEDTHLTMEIGF